MQAVVVIQFLLDEENYSTCGDTLPSAGHFIVHGLVVPSIPTYMLTSSPERLQNTKGRAAYQVTFVQRKK